MRLVMAGKMIGEKMQRLNPLEIRSLRTYGGAP